MAMRPLTVITPGESLRAGRLLPHEPYVTWRIHGTDDWQLIHTLSGHGRFGWSGGECSALCGDVMLLRPGTRHDYGAHPDAATWANEWVHFRAPESWLELLDWPEIAPGVMRVQTTDSVRGHVHEALREVQRQALAASPRRLRFAMNALERALLWCREVLPENNHARLDHRIQQVLDLLENDLAATPSVAELSRLVGLSPSRFAHLFRAQMGIPLQRYHEEQRLRRACQLLTATKRSIKSIAEEVGFADQLYFSQRFRRFTGNGPRAWRQAH